MTDAEENLQDSCVLREAGESPTLFLTEIARGLQIWRLLLGSFLGKTFRTLYIWATEAS